MISSDSKNLTDFYDADGVRQLEAMAINQGVSGSELMLIAGRFAYESIRRCWPLARRIAVFCGTGNNGGDGYVVAQLALEDGLNVVIAKTGEPKSGEAREAAGRCHVPRLALADIENSDYDVFVDAILGNGVVSIARGEALAFIRRLDRSRSEHLPPVLSIDVPSGLNSTTGFAPGPCVRADLTCTFIAMKLGLATGIGPTMAGDVFLHRLKLPDALYDQVEPRAVRIEPDLLKVRAIARSQHAHKGKAGRVLVIGGDINYAGAVRLTAEAALRTGAGLVTVITREAHYPHLIQSRPEVMYVGMEKSQDAVEQIKASDIVAVGPGLGQRRWGRDFFNAALQHSRQLVVDADALNILAQDSRLVENAVLTPHPAEAARLLETDVRDIESDRPAAVAALCSRYGSAIVLKGAGTLVASPSSPLEICDRGHFGMATAGMGDVLTGVIAALRAQGAKPVSAASLGVWLHAVAAEDAGADGRIGIVASDLMQPLRRRRSALIERNF